MTRDVETDQGCCGTGSPPDSTTDETEAGCCGPAPSSEPGGIETAQGCCGTEPSNESAGVESGQGCGGSESSSESVEIETDQGCCGTPGDAPSSSCGGDSAVSSTGGDPFQDEESASSVVIPDTAKSSDEIAAIETAAELTVGFLGEMRAAWAPDWTEADVAEFLHDRLRAADHDPAWAWAYCPAVHAGAGARIGHTEPGDRSVPPGELLHVDFGVSHEGYAADLQRVYYHSDGAADSIPETLETAFEAVRSALEAGREALEPGVAGYEVDAAARSTLTDEGWNEFDHAFGHQVGRDAHDGGTLLGPPRERYGDRPFGTVTTGEVYSIELGVGTVYGYVGLEEMVRVTEEGAEFLVAPQTDLQRLPVR